MLAKLISDLLAGAPSRTAEIPVNIAGVTCKLTVEQLLRLATPEDSGSAPAVHGLLTHVAAGLTSGHVLVATGSSTFEFRKLTEANLPNPAGIDVTGNAGTASRLLNPRQIAGVNFDGTQAIAIPHGNLSDVGAKTHAALDAHVDDATKHRVINDAGTLATDLWSAAQILAQLATKAASGHLHAGTYEPANGNIQSHIADATKHRVINDAGTLTTDLWSAARIIAQLATKAATGHLHTGTYEPVNANIQSHIGDAAKHRTINDAGTLDTDLWSAAQIIAQLATKAASGHLHTGTYEPANANIQSHIGDAAKHRVINDAGTLATDLWSAAQIITQLATKAATGHNHAGTYEPANANIQTHIGDATKHRLINDAGTLATDLWSAAQIIAQLATKAAASHNHALAGLSERAYGSLTGRPSFFAVIAVAGQTSVAADAEGDTLTLVAGAGIVITTDPATDEVTITNIGGGIPGPHGHTGPADGGAFTSLAVQGNPVWHAGNDGDGSGLDADTLDGMQPSSASAGGTVVARDANGDFSGRYVNAVYLNMSHAASARMTDVVFFSSTDAYIRKNTKAGMLASLGLANAWTADNDGPASGLDADTVDGMHADELVSPALRIVMAQQFGGF